MVDPYQAGAEAMRAAIMRALIDEACVAEKTQTLVAQVRGAAIRTAWLLAKHVSIPTSPAPERGSSGGPHRLPDWIASG